jgi:hypothetical protein
MKAGFLRFWVRTGGPVVLCVAAVLVPLLHAQAPPGESQESYLQWSLKQAEEIAKSTRINGRVGGFWDTRVIRTESSYNFKLRATWFTPEVIRATARYFQLRQGLTDAATRALVEEAEAAGDTVVLVEIDPREGSGVIPLEWEAYLRPRAEKNSGFMGVAGLKIDKLRDIKVLASLMPRDYSYDRFWIVFRLADDHVQSIFPGTARECELVVRIHDKEGRVTWTIPESIRQRAAAPAAKR